MNQMEQSTLRHSTTVLVQILSSWPLEKIFPALDLIRMIVLCPAANFLSTVQPFVNSNQKKQKLQNNKNNTTFWTSLLEFLDPSYPTNSMLVMRIFLNALSNSCLSVHFKPLVLAQLITNASQITNANSQNLVLNKTFSGLLLNCSICEVDPFLLIPEINTVMGHSHPSVLLNALLALGTLLVNSDDAIAIALSHAGMIERIKLLKDTKVPTGGDATGKGSEWDSICLVVGELVTLLNI
eukprot:TRINITY_DN4924_c0_g1_i4.p1 TRINITY_DN4924_c0_g1~~TRINITY_DN4924_c0_g1_i4.p1  ORF type:complete len:239 (-),score=58.26 TRINITY_DN4924_c0_g1_i4:50-766(-)